MKFESLRAFDGVPHLRFRCVRLSDHQIFGDRTVEQQRFLKDHTDVAPQCREPEFADVSAVNVDLTGLRIESAVEQSDGGRFSGARCTDKRDRFAGHG